MYSSKIIRRTVGVAAVAIALVFTTASFAQQPGRIRGQIEKADSGTLSLKQRDGSMLNVKVAEDARVAALVKASLDDIKNDSFIGVAGMPRPDGSIEAFSVHIFLPAQRGVVADRHFDWDAKPGSTMTNAYVASSVKEKDGQTLTLKYKDGEKKIIVTPATAITAVAPGNKEELKPGAQIIIMASDKQADGSVLAKTLYIGRSLTPAM
jgi:hypothetical protein